MPRNQQIKTSLCIRPSLPILPSALVTGALPLSIGVPLPETKIRLPQGFSQTPHHGDTLPTPGPSCLCASLAGAWRAPPPQPAAGQYTCLPSCHPSDPQHRRHPLSRRAQSPWSLGVKTPHMPKPLPKPSTQPGGHDFVFLFLNRTPKWFPQLKPHGTWLFPALRALHTWCKTGA